MRHPVRKLVKRYFLKNEKNAFEVRVHHYTRVVQTVHLLQDLLTAVCLHRMFTPYKHGRECNIIA